MNVCVLILAAGQATRYGADKRLATLPDGHRVIDAVLQQVIASELPFLLCLNARDTSLAKELELRRIPVHRCLRANEGMGATLAEGIAQLVDRDGVLISLGDMPWIQATTYRAVAGQLETTAICVPTYQQRAGHPVGFSAGYFAELAALNGDHGARKLLEKYNDRVHKLTVDDAAILSDVDVPSDLQRMH